MRSRTETGLASVVAAAAAALLASSSAHAQQIGVNFEGDAGAAGQVMAGQTAGVVGQTNWNNAAGNTGSLPNLVSATGATTGATVTWQSQGLWSTDKEDNTSQFANPGDEALMNGYLDTNEGTTSSFITVTGLTPGAYNVYVYSLTAVNNRDSGNIIVEGVREKSISTISTAFQEGGGPGGDDNIGGVLGNYNLYPVVLNDGELNMTLSGETFRTAVNGFQVVPAVVPEPASLGLLGLGAVGLLARRRRNVD